MMLSAYYILNIEYAEMACVTLEFIQRGPSRMLPPALKSSSVIFCITCECHHICHIYYHIYYHICL
ncbi:unnamed protein product [Larinioides sclopetarius]|uniref:Uncharacterized protein n=1 Tax=Larinioides sclopetarius TaxID=280406 RepID=A0AAV2BW96_9ARAC